MTWFQSPGASVASNSDPSVHATSMGDAGWLVYRDGQLIATLDSLNALGERVLRIHEADKCGGRPCSVHRPSEHHMKTWRREWRGDRYMLERICPHGIGHPDPDHMDYIEREFGPEKARVDGVHGCDGCCVPPKGV